jgi:hypothetical protein
VREELTRLVVHWLTSFGSVSRSGISFFRFANGEIYCQYDLSFSEFGAIRGVDGKYEDDPSKRHPFGKRVWYGLVTKAPAILTFTDVEKAALDTGEARLMFIVDSEHSSGRGRATVSRDQLYEWSLFDFTAFNTLDASFDYLPIEVVVFFENRAAAPREGPVEDEDQFDFERYY